VLTNEEKRIMRQNAILNGGYYDENNRWNAVKVIGNNLYRNRIETIIIKDNKFAFIKVTNDPGKYKLPGGSLDKDTTLEQQAINECHEETHFEVSNISNTGITYMINYPNDNRNKDTYYKYGIKLTGAYTQIFTARYDGKYTGHIDDVDEDPYVRSGKWYTFKEAFGIFNKHHKDALSQYIKNNNIVSDNDKMNEYTMEGYVFNRLKNHFQLKDKSIKEIDILKLNKLLDTISLKYDLEKRRYHPSGSSSLGIYKIPVKNNYIDINVEILVYYALDEDSPAFTTYSPENHRNYIILSPYFFENIDRESQLYIFMHEVGHIRLGHVMPKNMLKKRGEYIYNQKRIEDIQKGKVSYTELNADTYSVINGGKRNRILDLTKRSDDYFSTINNQELARRYDIATKRKQVFDKKYGYDTYESNEDIIDGDYTTESYFFNWFSNELKLWSKEIRSDFPKEAVENILLVLNKAYKSHKSDKKYQNKNAYCFMSLKTPKYKENIKFSIEYIQFCISFADTASGPAYAMATDDGFYLVVVTPEFFTLSKDAQQFALLHEVGHIRLEHVAPQNYPCDIFGNPIYGGQRMADILNGGTMYTELNADLYAVLNGAKLYAILDIVFKKDFDEKGNPFIYTNYELSDRYKKTTERALRRELFGKGLPKIHPTTKPYRAL
jgi:8-oxo-dGTP pyrophosphatase MutT (NUDIX family)